MPETSSSPRLRLLAWLGLALGLVWLLAWVGIPLTAEPRASRCQRVPGVWRGIYHVHPLGHDGQDRSNRMVEAARESCLDFLVVTNHHGLDWEGSKAAASMGVRSLGEPLLLDGAEWTVGGKHHEGQLAGTFGWEASAETVDYRVLHHPSWSGFPSFSDLPDATVDQLAAGNMAMEVLNGPRLLRQARDGSAMLLALAAGLGRSDLFLSALALPGQDLAIWLQAQAELGRSIPLVCGSDAHGGTTDFRVLFPATMLYVEQPPARRGDPIGPDDLVSALRGGRVSCVNEHLGSPNLLALRPVEGTPCEVEVVAALDERGDWRLLRDGQEVARGRQGERVTLSERGVYHLEAWRRVDFGLAGEHDRLWAVGPSVVVTDVCGGDG